MKGIAIALALLDFAPVFFLSLGLFFLAQLVDRLDPRCRRMAVAGFLLVTIGGLGRAMSGLAATALETEIPLLATTLLVFGGPGFTLMAAALFRARATAIAGQPERDPWLAPTAISWLFLLGAFYLNASLGGNAWTYVLLTLLLAGNAATCFGAARLGWKRQLHMAAALLALNVAGTGAVAALKSLSSQPILLQLLEVLIQIAAQAAFAFAAWRVAAEYRARVGPTAGGV